MSVGVDSVYVLAEEGHPTCADDGPRALVPVKIGYTSKTPESRVRQYQAGNHRRLVCIRAIPGTMVDEHALHELFAPWRIHGEWFSLTTYLLEVIRTSRAVDAIALRFELRDLIDWGNLMREEAVA